jgi:single-stranded DNA-binding protein
MTKKYDAVATIGEYTNKQGEKKKRYLTVGAVMEGTDGRMALKLDALPTNPEWSGWIAFYEPKQQDGYQQRESPQRPAAPARKVAAPAAYDDEDDDIPF